MASDLTFDGQREGEKVEFIFRKKASVAGKGVLWLVICMIIGVMPMVMWPGQTVMLWVFLGATGVGILGVLYTYILWYFSIYIVTNERVRQIRQKGLFKKSMIDIWLDKVENVSFQQMGLFDKGTIMIQTVVGDLTISKVPHPEEVYNKLQNLVGRTSRDEED